MPRTDRDGGTVRLSLSRLAGRPVHDGEIAAALDLPISTYNRRKHKADFPTFDELREIANRIQVDEMVLQVDFGYLNVASLNSDLQQRYAAYRHAVGVMESLRGGAPGDAAGRTAGPPEGRRDVRAVPGSPSVTAHREPVTTLR